MTHIHCQPRRILIVDDRPSIHEEFAGILCSQSCIEPLVRDSFVDSGPEFSSEAPADYELEHAFHGREALEKIQHAMIHDNTFDLAFVDMRMPPGWDGLRTIEQLWQADRNLHVVLCTGCSESWQEIDARLGRSDQLLILKKPFDAAEVSQMAAAMTRKRQLQRLQHSDMRHQKKQMRSQTAAVLRAHEETIHLLVRAADQRDTETGNHIKRVGLYSARLAAVYGLDQNEVDLIRLAAPMHDVGKIGIPDNVLRKPGALTDEERHIMETHTLLGAEMLSGSQSPVICKAREIALCHHERWDGRGYPRGIAGEEIPLAARIVAVADVYDDLTQDHNYRSVMLEPRALEVLRAGRGKQFDPRLIDLATSLTRDFQLIAAVHPDDATEQNTAGELQTPPLQLCDACM